MKQETIILVAAAGIVGYLLYKKSLSTVLSPTMTTGGSNSTPLISGGYNTYNPGVVNPLVSIAPTVQPNVPLNPLNLQFDQIELE